MACLTPMHAVMREVDETCGKTGFCVWGNMCGVSQFRIPLSEPLLDSAILLPLVSVDL